MTLKETQIWWEWNIGGVTVMELTLKILTWVELSWKWDTRNSNKQGKCIADEIGKSSDIKKW